MNKETLTKHIKALLLQATDETAKTMPEMYPEWVAVVIKNGKEHKAKHKKGDRVRYADKLYTVIKNHNIKYKTETPDVMTDYYQEVV